jgi:hypothetical protein
MPECMDRDGMESRAARRSISVSIVILVMRHSFLLMLAMLMLVVTHGMRLWMVQQPVHYSYRGGL